MPKRVPTIAITVIRDGKRVTPEPNKKAFDFTKEEIESISKQMPSAFRKPVNEEADNDAEGATAASAPEKTLKPTANKTPKTRAKTAAAQKDSTSDEAINAADDDDDATHDAGDAADDAAGEDDDI
jgi:hypothetical protein